MKPVRLVKRFVAASFALFTVGLLACARQQEKIPGLIYKQLLKSPGVEYYHVPIGLCEDYPEETTTIEIIRNDFELLKRSGINLLRISFGWDAIEVAKDQYDWLFWDDFVKMAVDEYKITLIPYICYTPMWNSTGDSVNYWNHTPRDYEEFGQFVEDLVKRYKNRIKSWELWNEPDIDAFWSGSVEEYARLLKIGAQAVRRADPDAIVVLGGLAHNTDFTLALFKDLDVSRYVNVVNIHNYFETWSPSPLESIVDYANTIHDIVEKYGDNQSIWMAEVGYSSYRRNAHVSDSYRAYYDYEHTPEFQAVQLCRTLTLLLSTEKLAAIAWYEIKDLPKTEEVIGDVNNRHLGVAKYNHEPKPAETALAFFNRLFSDNYKSIDDQVKVNRKLKSHSVIHCFQTEGGDVIAVGWLKTNFAGRKPDTSGHVQDTRLEKVGLEIPVVLSGTATLYDELGNASEFKNMTVAAGKTVLNDIELAGGKIAIIRITK